MAPAENIHIPRGSRPEPGPLYSDFFQQQVAKQRNNNYHSTSLRNMVATSVNRTALHPGGVQPGKSHTELEEELHEHAHIDYERVAIIANPSVAALYEDALVYETGTAITSSGALTAYSGAKTGRSPSDKRIVKEESSEKDIWWGPVNKPMTPEVSDPSPFQIAHSPLYRAFFSVVAPCSGFLAALPGSPAHAYQRGQAFWQHTGLAHQP